jgi:hypothetical protein
LGDANKNAYAATIKKVKQKCRNPKFVIVGHGNYSKTSSLSHTLKMAEALKKQTATKE